MNSSLVGSVMKQDIRDMQLALLAYALCRVGEAGGVVWETKLK